MFGELAFSEGVLDVLFVPENTSELWIPTGGLTAQWNNIVTQLEEFNNGG